MASWMVANAAFARIRCAPIWVADHATGPATQTGLPGPDGAMTWFRSEKNTNWEGAFRVPCLVRWPTVIKSNTVTNELMSHNDWIPTLCSIAGEPEIRAEFAYHREHEMAQTPADSLLRRTRLGLFHPDLLRTERGNP